MDTKQLIDTIFNGFNSAGILIGVALIFYSWKSSYTFKGKWIIPWLATMTIHQVYFFLNLNQLIPKHHIFSLLGYPLALVHLPLFYLNIRALTNHTSKTSSLAYLHFIPYLIVSVFLIDQYFSSNGAAYAVNGFLYLPTNTPNFLLIAHGTPMALSGVVYVSLSLILVERFKKNLSDFYAKTQDIDLAWIQRMVIFLGFLFLSIYFLIVFGTGYSFYSMELVFRYVSINMTCFMAYYGYRYLKQIEVFYKTKMNQIRATKPKYAHSSLSKMQMEKIQAKVLQVLKEHQLYLDEEFTLAKLASQTGESAQKLSETLNRQMQQSFYELINSHRIAQAKKMLRDPAFEKLSIEGIAFDCGFKSKSTFFKLFKKETGLTPNQYKTKNSGIN